jgi:hypothetical protein
VASQYRRKARLHDPGIAGQLGAAQAGHSMHCATTLRAHIVRERLNEHHQDEARALVRDLCTTPADLVPDEQAKTLIITLHSLATPKDNAAVAHLCAELNATKTLYPGTDLRMVL